MGDFDRLENEIASREISRGAKTGSVSAILSNVCLLALVYLLVQLFKDKHYLPLIIMLVLGFTRLGHWVSIGLFIYFVVSQYWVGASLILLYGGIGWFSFWFGLRNVKGNLGGRRANIDPLEGMHDLLFILILQLVFFGLALLTSGVLSIVFWVFFGLVTLFEILRYYHRLGSPWRRLHFPLMMHCFIILGKQMRSAESTGKESSIKEALYSLVKTAYPGMEDDEAYSLIDSAERRMDTFSDQGALTELSQKSNPSLDPAKRQAGMDTIETTLKYPKSDGSFIRYVIAEVIGRDYGEQERLKYIKAIITGQAT